LDPGAFLAQKWIVQLPSNLSHPCLPTQSLAQSPVPSVHMHRQVVNTGCGDDDFFLVGAEAHPGHRKLGRRAATLSSSTKLTYIFFAVGSMRSLPASGLLSPPFASARRAHPATGRPPLSPLSAGAARRRGGRHALEAGALEHILAEGLRPLQAGLLGEKNSAPAAGRRRSWRPPDGAAGAMCVGFLTEFGGTFLGVRCGCQVKNCRKIFYCRNG
jgi:hypothetical protein